MAGNTKLKGFAPDGMIVLERWGGEAHVEVSSDSLEAIRKACIDGLPKKPSELRPTDHLDDFNAGYDIHDGRAKVDVDTGVLEDLIAMFDSYVEEYTGVSGEPETRRLEQAQEWTGALKKVLQDKKNFLDLNEPGIRDEVPQ